MVKADMCPLTHTQAQKVCEHRSEWSRPQIAPRLAGPPKTDSPLATNGKHDIIGQDRCLQAGTAG